MAPHGCVVDVYDGIAPVPIIFNVFNAEHPVKIFDEAVVTENGYSIVANPVQPLKA